MANKTSLGQRELFEFIQSCGVDAVLEHVVNGLKYDIYVPARDLLIEYNGLKWHSMPHSRERDFEKYESSSGHNFLMIFEDEWKWCRLKVEALVKNRLGLIKSKGLRPSQTVIKLISASEADPFYDAHHYIGKVRAPINYGVFHQDKLIACTSFKRPTRQSSHEWELVRMASDSEFRVHGIWGKLIKQFIQSHAPKSIVSFSDNRLFNGGIYEKIGFNFDGDVIQDYYWIKGTRRHHKSSLRKTAEEKLTRLTEVQLREAQGYSRIWDLGKKRWVLKP